MLIGGIHHVSINVDDLAAAEGFYVGVLGMRTLDRPPLSVDGLWLDAGDGREVHLIEAETPENHGQHFAFLVDDVDETRSALLAAGVDADVPGEVSGICRQVFCRDPAGNRVEFNQRL